MWDPDLYQRNASFVSELGAGVIDLLDPQPGERVLDLGCGDGALTIKLVERGCHVVGVDASPRQIEAAKARDLDVRVLDARALEFEHDFDAVFSNAALHWIDDLDAVLTGVHRALKEGGRFVGEFGGSGNVATVVSAIYKALAGRGIDGGALNPWYFPSETDWRSMLEHHGFHVDWLVRFPRPTVLPGAFEDWMETFCRVFTDAVSEDDRAAFIRSVTETIRPELCDAHGTWTLDYVRLRFAATRLNDNS